MSDIANVEAHATFVTDFVYNQNNTEQKYWNFGFDASVSISFT